MATIHVYVRASGQVTNEQAAALQAQADALRQSLVDAGVDAKCGVSVTFDAEPLPVLAEEPHADPIPPDDSLEDS